MSSTQMTTRFDSKLVRLKVEDKEYHVFDTYRFDSKLVRLKVNFIFNLH